MKLSKSIVIAISSILCISSFSLLTYASDKELKTDLKNAIQTIGSIKFINKDNTSSSGTLSPGNNNLNLKITTNNFIITMTGENENEIKNSKGSSILGGRKNTISNGNTGTILGGYNNKIEKGSSSSILGGSGNKIEGDNSVIIGGKSNNIKGNNSTILGTNNTLNGNNSSLIGTDNNVKGNSSIVLGSKGTINTDKTFLWNDGENTISSDHKNTFSIISKNGMVINTNKAADGAQLTINGSLSIFDSFKNENIQCGDGKGNGILKVMDKGNNNDQICFCSCNGETRNSIFGKGQCEGVCKKGGPLEPKCLNEIEMVKNNNNTYYLTGGCDNGKIVILKDTQSWYKDGNNTQYRACQTDDGTAITCSGTINGVTRAQDNPT